MALALVMIYRATDLVNFAQGEMAMFSTYIAWSLVTAGLPFWAAFLITLVASFLGGMAIERIIIRPVENSLLTRSLSLSAWCWGGGGSSATPSRIFPARFRIGRCSAH